MLSEEDNQYFTQVGKGTPGGDFHRRYWHPIAATVELDKKPVAAVRVLGEDLVVYKAGNGTYGLVQRRCPHRAADMKQGWPDEEGIRCSYHGWYFDQQGQCIAQPFDDMVGAGTFKERVKVTAYPVQELGGLLWAYLGPDPAPLLPRWDLLLEEGVSRVIEWTMLPCNWLQVVENDLDPVHVEWLHVNQMNEAARRAGVEDLVTPFQHVNIDFAVFEYGIYKRRRALGDPEDSTDWTIGHPMVFPTTLAMNENLSSFRIPVDDTHTLHLVYEVRPPANGASPIDIWREHPCLDADGELLDAMTSVMQQDFNAWIGQGPLMPRHEETLSRSDKGITLYRRLLREAMEAVQRDEDPFGVIRDEEINNAGLHIEFEKKSPHVTRMSRLKFAAPMELLSQS